MYRNYSQDADRIVFGVKAIRKNPANIGTRHPGEIYRKVLGLLSSPEELETFHKVLRMSSKMILKEDGEKVIQGLQAYMEDPLLQRFWQNFFS